MASLKATKRDQTGTRPTRRLRDTGKIPGIIYGHKQDALAVTLEKHDIELAISHGERLLQVDVDGTTEDVLLKDVQYDTFGQHVLHVDLTRVDLHERVQVTVPVVLRGTPAGVNEGGVLQQMVSDVSIEVVVSAIPEEIRISVAALNVDDSLQIKDLPLPEGAILLDDGGAQLCSVTVVAEEAEELEEGAEGVEPEVIGEKPAEDGEGETEGEGKGKGKGKGK